LEAWEAHFRHKSARRAGRRLRSRLIKGGVVALILGSLAAAAYLGIAGLPR